MRAPWRRCLAGLMLTAAIVMATVSAPPPHASAEDVAALATIAWGGEVSLVSRPAGRKIVTTLAPGTTVALLEGPIGDGWYNVDPIALPEARPGWLHADQIAFDRYVRVMWDLPLFAEPAESAGVVTWLRHGVVLTITGPRQGDYLFVQYGDLAGYAYQPALAADAGPATNPYAERWVDVNRSTGEVRLMIGDTAVDTFQASLSRDQGEGFYATAIGTYYVYEKIAGLTYTPYANAYIMYWAGFDPSRFNGFHSWTMDAYGNVIDGGWGPTAGCVATEPSAAAIIFDFVEIGTRVVIHW
ncbi:MAG: hypothetical protein C4346_04540 [Chloroflexota bacterium]